MPSTVIRKLFVPRFQYKHHPRVEGLPLRLRHFLGARVIGRYLKKAFENHQLAPFE